MKRFLTILLMTVAFAMNVSVVNAKNSTGQGGTGKEFMMAMLADGDPKSTAIINGESKTWEYGTFQLLSWDSGANITFVIQNGNCSYLINGDNVTGNGYKSSSFAGNADKEIIVTVTQMGVYDNIYGKYRFVFEKDANQNYVCNYYGEYTGGGGSDPTKPATPEISIYSYKNSSTYGGYVYFNIEDDTENATIYYSKNDDSHYTEYKPNDKPYHYAYQITTDSYTIYSKAELNGQESTPTYKTFTLTDAPTVSLNGTTLSIPSDYNGFVYKVGDGSWTNAIGNTSANLTNAPAVGTEIKVRAYKTGYLFSNEVTYTVPAASGPNKPTINQKLQYSRSSGTGLINYVTITCDNGSTVHYTTNNNTPTSNDATVDQNNRFTISTYDISGNSLTVKAIAIDESSNSSDVAEYTFYKTDQPTYTDNGSSITINVPSGKAVAVKNNGSWTNYESNTTISKDQFSNIIVSAYDYSNGTTLFSDPLNFEVSSNIAPSITHNQAANQVTISGQGTIKYSTDNKSSWTTVSNGSTTLNIPENGSLTVYAYSTSKNFNTITTSNIVGGTTYNYVAKPAAPSISINHGLDDADCTHPDGQSSCQDVTDGCTINALNNYIYISTETNGATIYYTTDNSDPTNNNNVNRHELTDGKFIFDINQTGYDAMTSLTVKAAAFKDNVYSDVQSVTFNKSDTPSISRSDNTVTITATGLTWLAYKPNASSQWIRFVGITKTISNYTDGTQISAVAATSGCLLSNPTVYPEAPTLPVPEFTSSFQGKSDAGEVAPFVYFGISNYGTITATEGNQVLYSYDQTNWKSTFETKDTAPGVGCILAYASEFEGSGNTVTIYAKTVNGDNESAVVSKTYTKTDAPTVVWSSATQPYITITPPSTDWDEIIYSEDGGMNWSVITNDNSSTSYQIDVNYYGNAPIYVQARAINNDNAHIYSNEDCHIIGPATIEGNLTYVTKTLTNYVRINTLPRLTVKYTFDGTDPTAPESTPQQYDFPVNKDKNYFDTNAGTSLSIAGTSITVRTVATDGKGHTSTEDTKTFYKTEKPTFEDKGETFIVHGVKGTNNYDNKLYVKIGDNSDWESTSSVDQSYDKASYSLVQASALYTEYTKLFSDPIKVVVTDKVPTFTPNLNDNKVTITGDGTVRYSTDGGTTWNEADGQTGAIVDIPVGGLTVKAYITSTGTDNGIDTYYTSNVSTENYTYTTPTAEWTDWEPYGRGTFKDNCFFQNGTTMDIYVRTSTKEGESNIKQIKVANWESGWELAHNVETGYSPEFIFDWNTNTGVCTVSEYYTGISIAFPDGQDHYYFIQPTVGSTNGLYDPDTDTYSINFTYYQNSEKDKSGGSGTQDSNATLKMEGMWLGDMTEDESDDSAVQNSYMPQLSQYKIGLVKIPTSTDNTNNYLDFDESGVCRIVLDDIDENDDIEDDFDAFFNSINSTERHWLATDATNQLIENSTDVYKMLDQFTITDEGAYYIVVARQVPNGDGTYSYTGAYQYMPVYYSPASNWDEVGEEGCTYQEDVVGGSLYYKSEEYGSYIGSTNYPVIVEENVNTPGLYRVKNMYLYQDDSEYSFNPTSEYWTYQGEDAGRKNVYFYIDATNPNSVTLYNDMFYAQPLGVGFDRGEMMLVDLGTGILTKDGNGIHIKFNADGQQSGKFYEWEDCRNCGYEYDGTYEFNWKYTNADATASNRFDLFIPTPSKTQPDAPTITYTEGSGKVTISTDEEGTTDYPVYLIYTTDENEPSYTVGQDGVPTASDANTVVVTGTSTSFYITSTTTVNAKVYCGKYTTPASENAEDEFTIVAPTVATTVKMNNDATTFNTKDGVPDQINYFVIYQANNYAVDFDHYSIEYQLLQDGKLLYSPDGNSYKACTEVITSQAGNLIFFDPINSYIYDSEYKHSNAFNNDHPLTIRVQVKNKNGNNLGGCSSTTFTESSAAIPVLNAENNTITIDAQNRAGLYLYYNYYDVNVEDYVWSGQKSKDHLPLTFKDYNVESSPREIYTISWQADHLKVQTEPLSISKYTRPDAPKISYDEENSTITISTDEIKGTTTDSYVYLIYTTDGTEPSYTVGQDGAPTATDGTNTVVVNGSSETISNITESKNIKALVYCPDENRFCQFDSEISTKVCAKWMAWEPYGTGSCADGFNINKFSSGHSMTDHSLVHYDIEVRTDAYNIYHKQIKIKGWSSARANKSVNCNVNGSRANSVNVELLQDDDYKSELYDDLILDWDMENNKIRIDKSHFTGLYCVLNDVRRYLWIPEKDDNAEDNGYHPEIDAYLNNISYVFSGSTEDVPHGVPSLLYLNLKMDGLWLGDMTENGNTATQEAFMPQNSHYKIGLVKIDRKNDNLKFENDEDSDDFGKCFIELTDSSKVGTFFDCTDNFVDGTVKVRHLNDGSNYIPLETGDENETVMKMKEEFDFDAADVGAYYIAVARMVPNGDGTYSYTGAYRYMPVYFSPANNWETITYDGKRRFVEGLAYQFYQFNVSCNYYDDWNEAWNITGLGNPTWMDDIENPRYSVTVQENKNEHGLFRVKNLYHNGFMGYDEDATENPLDKDIVSYQGESPYRDVYFYIDARKEIDGEDQIIEDEETDEKYYPAKLYPSEFYAQPLGVDWEMGELMLSNLDGGKYVDGHIIFEDEGNVYEPEDIEHLIINLTGQDIYCSSGHIVKTSTFYKLGNEVFSTNWDYNDEYDPEYELYDNRFQLQISTPYPLFDDTPYSLKADDEEDETVKDMNDKWKEEYEYKDEEKGIDNSEDYAEKYGELAIFDKESEYYVKCYTNGIENGQDHVDVTYERDLKEYNNTWGTIMLPCPLKASDLKLEVNGEIYVDEEAEEGTNAFNLYRISGFSTDHQKVMFTNIGEEIVNPNTPVVFKSNQHIASLDVTDGTTIKLVIDNKDTKVDAIGASTDENTSYVTTTKDENGLYIYDDKSSWWTIANYTPVAFTTEANRKSAEATGYHVETSYELPKSYVINCDEIKQATGGIRNKQYRAFFYLYSNPNPTQPVSAKSYSVFFDDDPSITDIDSVVDSRSVRTGSYNVAGQKVNRNYRGIVIENGKKSIRLKR